MAALFHCEGSETCATAVEIGVNGVEKPDGKVVCFGCEPELAALPCDICALLGGHKAWCPESDERRRMDRLEEGARASREFREELQSRKD